MLRVGLSHERAGNNPSAEFGSSSVDLKHFILIKSHRNQRRLVYFSSLKRNIFYGDEKWDLEEVCNLEGVGQGCQVT